MSMVKLMQVCELIKCDHELHSWLAIGIQRYREGDDFSAALDITGSRAEAAAREALLRAAKCIDPSHSKSVNALSDELSLEVDRFEQRVWPRAKKYENPDALAPLDQALWEAMTSWAGFPKSARRLFDLLTQAGWQRQKVRCQDASITATDRLETNDA